MHDILALGLFLVISSMHKTAFQNFDLPPIWLSVKIVPFRPQARRRATRSTSISIKKTTLLAMKIYTVVLM